MRESPVLLDMDAVVETLCAELEATKSPTEVVIVADRVAIVGKKLGGFSNLHWGLLTETLNECNLRTQRENNLKGD